MKNWVISCSPEFRQTHSKIWIWLKSFEELSRVGTSFIRLSAPVGTKEYCCSDKVREHGSSVYAVKGNGLLCIGREIEVC